MEKAVHAEGYKNWKGIQRVEVDFIRVVFTFPTSLQMYHQMLGALQIDAKYRCKDSTTQYCRIMMILSAGDTA